MLVKLLIFMVGLVLIMIAGTIGVYLKNPAWFDLLLHGPKATPRVGTTTTASAPTAALSVGALPAAPSASASAAPSASVSGAASARVAPLAKPKPLTAPPASGKYNFNQGL